MRLSLTFHKLHRHFAAEVSPIDLRGLADRATLDTTLDIEPSSA